MRLCKLWCVVRYSHGHLYSDVSVPAPIPVLVLVRVSVPMRVLFVGVSWWFRGLHHSAMAAGLADTAAAPLNRVKSLLQSGCDLSLLHTKVRASGRGRRGKAERLRDAECDAELET